MSRIKARRLKGWAIMTGALVVLLAVVAAASPRLALGCGVVLGILHVILLVTILADR